MSTSDAVIGALIKTKGHSGILPEERNLSGYITQIYMHAGKKRFGLSIYGLQTRGWKRSDFTVTGPPPKPSGHERPLDGGHIL